jgi:hypothetical protein
VKWLVWADRDGNDGKLDPQKGKGFGIGLRSGPTASVKSGPNFPHSNTCFRNFGRPVAAGNSD